MADSAPALIRIGVRVYIYLAAAILILNFIMLVVTVGALYDIEDALVALVTLATVLVLGNLAIWFTCRRCSAPDLSGWKGLLLMTAYMSTAMGGIHRRSMSLFIVAVPAAIVAIVISLAITLVSVLRVDPELARRNFRRLVLFYYRHRMYQ